MKAGLWSCREINYLRYLKGRSQLPPGEGDKEQQLCVCTPVLLESEGQSECMPGVQEGCWREKQDLVGEARGTTGCLGSEGNSGRRGESVSNPHPENCR